MGHLSPWMPWATPSNATPEVQSARLVQVELHWVNGTDFDYLIVTGGGSQVAPDTIAGRLSLMTRQGAGVLEIGYWLSADQTGRGFVTNAARALTTAAIPKRLGYTLDRVVDREPVASGDTGREMVWTMQKAHWSAGVGS